jgi:DNA-binding NtrC family response regulator
VLQTGEFMRVGGTKPVSVDVRFLAASNRNLEEAIVSGEFRSDLFYRLNVVSVHLLPLRERREDLPLLIRHFTATKAADLGVEERSFTPEAIDAMLGYHWPGNVRELENLIERVLVLSSSGPIHLDELPDALRREGNRAAEAMRDDVRAGKRSLPDAVSQFEREMIREALEESEFNQTRAARRLGTTRRILKYRMDKLGLTDR